MLKLGDIAPDFVGTTTDGRTLQISALRGKKIILYFFPKAFTQGCTLETRKFRDWYPDLTKMGIEVIGVSTDSNETQCAFAEKEQISFPMLADENKEISKKYKVLWPILGINQRVTYLIDENGRIEAVFHNELRIEKHIDAIRQHVIASNSSQEKS